MKYPVLVFSIILLTANAVCGQVFIDYVDNECPSADRLTVCIGANNVYAGNYNYKTYDHFCGDTVKGEVRIFRNELGEYFVDDFSFGLWGECYGIESPTGTLRLNIDCNEVLGISGTDNFGDVWGSDEVIYTGNSFIISWFNSYPEYGVTELIPKDGRAIVTPETILESDFNFLWSTGETTQTIETNDTGLFTVEVTGPDDFREQASVFIGENINSFDGECGDKILELTYFLDENRNGSMDSGEQKVLTGEKYVSLQPEELAFAYEGRYAERYALQNSNVNIIDVHPFCDISNNPGTINADQINDIQTINLGLYSTQAAPDIRIDLSARAVERCNTVVPFQMVVRNTGTEAYKGSVGIAFDPVIRYINSNTPENSVAEGYLSWIVDLTHHGSEQIIRFNMQMPSVDYVGELFCLIPDDGSNQKEYDNFCFELRCAYDPNDKRVTPYRGEEKNLTLFEEELKYTIRFENLGNDTAFNVRIEDTLDPKLDLSTFRFLQSSHELSRYFIDSNRKLIFDFQNIQLPSIEQDSIENKGFVQFAIRPVETIEELDVINNTAGIFFDFNDPIITNTIKNTFVESFGTSSNNDLTEGTGNYHIFPNPASDRLFVKSGFASFEYNIFDQTGRLLKVGSYNANGIELEDLSVGFYFLQCISPNRRGFESLRFVKM
jgi:uncharacterized repeat protein (TIGR01451 family)